MAFATFTADSPGNVPDRWQRSIGASGGVLELMELARDGLSVEAFDRFGTLAGLSREELAAALHTTTRTVARRREANKPLDSRSSERLVRLALLYGRATEVLGDESIVRQWMKTPRDLFGGLTPFQMASSELGAQEVEDLLTRTEHGVFA